ncbi:MAG: hypothetical protein ABEI96_06035 [Haloarculaceae archaeon]
MSRSSGRGQLEPVPALLAVLAVVAGLTLYVGVVDDALPGSRSRAVAGDVADTVERTASVAGAVRPGRLDAGRATAPDGYDCNVTLVVDGRRWTSGPSPVPGAQRTTRLVGVRLSPGRVRRGRLGVTVWR